MADEFIVDLMFNACGETYQSLSPFAEQTDIDGIKIKTISLEGLLRTKMTVREKNRLDRAVIERAIEAIKK